LDNRAKRFLIDVSNIVHGGVGDGVFKVTRNLLTEWLKSPPCGYDVTPICDDGISYKYVKTDDILSKIKAKQPLELNEDVSVYQGDIFLNLTCAPFAIHKRKNVYCAWKEAGVKIFWILHDIIPIRYPEYCNVGNDVVIAKWLRVVTETADGIVTVSRFVADDLHSYLKEKKFSRDEELKIGYAPNGVEDEMMASTKGRKLSQDENKKFLMVGTITPRKGYVQVLEAFELLWKDSVPVRLTFIGSPYWNVGRFVSLKFNTFAMRLPKHPELGRRLEWLRGVPDAIVSEAYASSSALIYASNAEGFGLPLIEAAQNGLPIIARDLPLYREVAGDSAFYFKGDKPEDLARAVLEWLDLDKRDLAPKPIGMRWLSAKESAERWKEVIFGGDWYRIYRGKSNKEIGDA
jgi:glycosyltransferase involved in cell wall biosynthesis